MKLVIGLHLDIGYDMKLVLVWIWTWLLI